jgi:hypothetical protein
LNFITPWRAPAPAGEQSFLRPCEPTLADRPPAGAGWLHEIKHDGFRVLARKRGDRVQIWSRRGTDFTYRFPAIAEAVRSLAVDRALIDGEAVVLREDGRSDFGAHAVILDSGEEAFAALMKFANDAKLTAASLTAIGAFERATIGWFDFEKKTYKKGSLRGPGAARREQRCTELVGEFRRLWRAGPRVGNSYADTLRFRYCA